MTSLNGSKPRWASSGTASSRCSGVVTNISPKVRGSMNRSCPAWVKVMTTWVCLPTGSLADLGRSSWPLMPRCTTSPSAASPPRAPPAASSRRTRYFPLRSTATTLRPSSRETKPCASRWRRIDRFPSTSTDLIRLPVTSLSRSLRIVSTSGSSGIRLRSRRVGFARWRFVRFRVRAVVAPDDRTPRDQRSPGRAGSGLLGLLLRPAFTVALGHAFEANRGEELLGVIRPFVDDLVARQRVVVPGSQLLQPGLVVVPARSFGGGGDAGAHQVHDQLGSGIPPAVE